LREPSESSWIARGLGRSYGDSALNPASSGGTVLLDDINHLAAFDPATGAVTCAAGVSFAELIDVFLPRGWFLPVTPGTKFVTVGGAIAADIHGKNHHVDGTFGRFVDSLDLLTADGEVLTCSPSERADVFWATIGGMGLTGVILRATFRLRKVESAYVNVDYRKAKNLDEAFDLFQEGDQAYRYSVAWVDCLASGENLGRSVLMRGDHAAVADLPPSLRSRPLALRAKRTKSIPFNFPSFVLNPWSVKAFNALYYARHHDGRKLVSYDAFFYPLDGILHWNRMYGRRGFIQYQALFPPESSRAGMRALLEAIAGSRMASFLAVLKSTGAANPGLLSFPKPGHTLALDLPNAEARLRNLVERLDAIVLEHGGRLYLAKDAMMSSGTFSRMYEKLDEFRGVRQRLDPRGRFSSAQARRLGIVGNAA
jgi:FAD/FMN-containing dehydrogenase